MLLAVLLSQDADWAYAACMHLKEDHISSVEGRQPYDIALHLIQSDLEATI